MSNINKFNTNSETLSTEIDTDINLISKFSALLKNKNSFPSVKRQGETYFKNKYNTKIKHDWGNLLMAADDFKSGDPFGSFNRLRYVLDNEPEFSDAHNLYIKIVTRIGKQDLIDEALHDAVKNHPNNPIFLNMIGKNLLLAKGEKYKALEYIEKSVEKNPHDCIYWLDLAFCYFAVRNIKMVSLCLATAQKIDSTNKRCFMLSSLMFQEDSKYDEAIKILEHALNLYPNDKDIIVDLSMLYLKHGRKEDGFRLYSLIESTNRTNLYQLFDHSKMNTKTDHIKEIKAIKDLDKKSLTLKKKYKILVFLEQGCGDILNFYRYLKPLLKKGHTLTAVTHQKSIIPLLKEVSGMEKVNLTSEIEYKNIKNYDFKTLILNIPYILNIPQSPPPSILINISKVKKNNKELNTKIKKLIDKNKKNIGISWKGNKRHLYDESRSINLNIFSEIFKNNNCNFFVITKDINQDERIFLKQFKNVILCDHLISDWCDTAIIVSLLNEVITVDTSLAHISATLDKPTRILIAKEPDWRWGISGKKSEWYKSVELLRQSDPDNWEIIINDLSKKLA